MKKLLLMVCLSCLGLGLSPAVLATSQQSTLCIVNFSDAAITNTHVSQIDNYDWDGPSRPDNNFQGVGIGFNSSRCQRAEMNYWTTSAWYRMTFDFSNGAEALSFRNDQKDAATKFNRSHPATTPPGSQLELYQEAGGDTNAMYIRPYQEPDNSDWMHNLLARNPTLKLNGIVMPGSHDAGIYMTTGCTFAVSPEWAKTQTLNIAGQLKAGSRYFDLRVYYDGSQYRLGHFGGLGGCYGDTLDAVLNQVKNFFNGSGAQETVILKFSHTMSDSPNLSQTPSQVAAATVQSVKNKLGSLMHTSSTYTNLAEVELSQLSGKVIAIFGSEFTTDRQTGIFAESELSIFDEYSDTTSLPFMEADQVNKLSIHGGLNSSKMFLLSWTLTGALGELDIEALTSKALPWLPARLANFKTKVNDTNPKIPNIVYIDFIDPYMGQAIIEVNKHLQMTVPQQVSWTGASGGFVPSGSLTGGYENSGSSLYVCRAEHADGLHIGKVRSGLGGCNIGYGGSEITKYSYDVLAISGSSWWSTQYYPYIPSGSVVGGTEPDGRLLYVCRGNYGGGKHPGKINEYFNGCHIGYGGGELVVSSYDILMINPQSPVMTYPAVTGCNANISVGQQINGSWDNSCRSVHRSNNHYAKYYTFTLSQSTVVTIDLTSSEDTYLYLLNGANENGSVITYNDDGGIGLNSRITYTLNAGTYTIEATTYSQNRTGNFSLSM